MQNKISALRCNYDNITWIPIWKFYSMHYPAKFLQWNDIIFHAHFLVVVHVYTGDNSQSSQEETVATPTKTTFAARLTKHAPTGHRCISKSGAKQIPPDPYLLSAFLYPGPSKSKSISQNRSSAPQTTEGQQQRQRQRQTTSVVQWNTKWLCWAV